MRFTARPDRLTSPEGAKNMACEDMIQGCLTTNASAFAGTEVDRERALNYLHCCWRNNVSWRDAEQQIREHLKAQGLNEAGITSQLRHVGRLLQPWLS
jgi:hypothetical protein